MKRRCQEGLGKGGRELPMPQNHITKSGFLPRPWESRVIMSWESKAAGSLESGTSRSPMKGRCISGSWEGEGNSSCSKATQSSH